MFRVGEVGVHKTKFGMEMQTEKEIVVVAVVARDGVGFMPGQIAGMEHDVLLFLSTILSGS